MREYIRFVDGGYGVGPSFFCQGVSDVRSCGSDSEEQDRAKDKPRGESGHPAWDTSSPCRLWGMGDEW